MLKPGSGPITVESRVDETITRYPSTAPISLQGGPLHVARPGQLYATYPGLTLGEHAAAQQSLAIERLLESLDASAKAEQFAQRTASIPRHFRRAPARKPGSANPRGKCRSSRPRC